MKRHEIIIRSLLIAMLLILVGSTIYGMENIRNHKSNYVPAHEAVSTQAVTDLDATQS